MNAFNQMFEKTRMPDPDDEGYGDWLRTAEDAKSSPTFGGKFNRDVFHKMFEDETVPGFAAPLPIAITGTTGDVPSYRYVRILLPVTV